MKLIPRSYQQEAFESIWTYFSGGGRGNPVIALPTGTGKSIVIAAFLEWVFERWPHQKILVVTHVKELIEQNYSKLATMAPNLGIGINSAGLGKRNYLHRVIFCGIGSVAKNAEKFGKIDLVLVDECHMVPVNPDSMYMSFFATLKHKNPAMKVIGLTATPWQLTRGHICEDPENLFTDVCYDGISMEKFNWFIDQGYLTTLIPKVTSFQIDTSGVGKSGGDFINSQLQVACNKDDITQRALEEAMEKGKDRRSWLIFTTGIEHAIDAANMLTEMGIPTFAVHSKLTKREREQGLADFKAGKYRAVTNNNVLTTGFDHPLIDLILILRPTESVVLWVQMLGRGTRPVYAPGFDLTTQEGRLAAQEQGGKHNCLVLDFAGNTRKIGQINDPKIPQRGKKGSGEAPMKECEKCQTYVPAGVRFCPCTDDKTGQVCGYEFVFETKLKQNVSTEQLIKTDLPVMEIFDVDTVEYTTHSKHGAPKSLLIVYNCGGRQFKSYVCIEHDGFAGRNAQKFWRARTNIPFPATTDDALKLMGRLKVPTNINVHVNKKFPEITAYCYDGSRFGEFAPCDKIVPVSECATKSTNKFSYMNANKGKVVSTL